MFFDALDESTSMDHAAEIAIVGSGPVGITLAKKLSKRFSVILIEAGGYKNSSIAKASLKGTVSGIPYPIADIRARMFGGSSSLWAGYCAQFDREDFEPCPWVPYSGWPICPDEVLNYYQEAADILHVKDACFNPNKLKSVKLEHIRPNFSDNFQTYVWRFGEKKADFAAENLKILTKMSDVKTLLNACVTNVHLSKQQNSSVEYLEVSTTNGRKGKVKAKLFILATGGIETPRLLLSSNKQNKHGAANKSGKVGRFFMEHPHVTIEGIKINDNATLDEWTKVIRTVKGQNFTPCLGINYSHRKQTNILNTRAHFYYSPDTLVDDTPKVGLFFEQAPNPNSKISLTKEVDQLGVPLVDLNWNLTALDTHSFKIAAKEVADELIRLKLASQTSEIGFSKEILYSNHQLGTTRMSKEPKDGVVDSNCKAHDLKNLYIVGGSVFPTVSWANPTMTVLALTLRLADHINNLQISKAR